MATEDLTFRFNVTGNAVPQFQKVQKQVRAVDRQVKRTTGTLKTHSSQYNSTAVATNKWAKGALQQAGFQVGDYAVQVANGTSAMQAFGQQGSQLLGVFGPIGAIIGAGVAIFSAIAVAFEKSAEAAKEAAGGAENFEDAIKKADSASSKAMKSIELAATTNIANARKEFSDFDGDLKGYLGTLARLRKEQALTAASLAADSFFSEKDVLGDLRQEYQSFIKEQKSLKAAVRDAQKTKNETISQYEREIQALRDLAAAQDRFSAQTTLNQVNQLQKELDAVRANSIEPFMSSLSLPQETIQNLLIFENAIKSAFDANNIVGAEKILGQMRREIEGLPKPIQDELLPGFLQLEGLARTLGVELGDVTGEASGLANEISRAAQEASRLMSNLATGKGLAAAGARLAGIRAEFGALESGQGELEAVMAKARAEKMAELGGTGVFQTPGAAAALKEVEDAVKQARLEFETSEYSARVSDLKASFDEVAATGGGAMDKIKSKTKQVAQELTPLQEKMKSVAETIESSMGDAFMSMVDGTKSAKDAFRDMARSIISQLFEMFVVKKITGFIASGIRNIGLGPSAGIPEFQIANS